MFELRHHEDLLRTRAAARALVRDAGLGIDDQTRFVNAVSELGANALQHAAAGVCELSDLSDARHLRLQATVRDGGPGIADLEGALCDRHAADGSADHGLPRARRMVDQFEIESTPAGTNVQVRIARARRPELALAGRPPAGPMAWIARALPHYMELFGRFLLAPTGAEGDLVREQSLLEATTLGRAALGEAARFDDIVDLHQRAQIAWAKRWNARTASDAERAARERLTREEARPLIQALIHPHLMARQARDEQRWREQHDKMNALFEQTEAMMLVLDASGKTEAANPAYTRATGWSPLQATTLFDAMWHGPLPPQVMEDVHLVQARRDGSHFNAAWAITPIHGSDGRLRSHVCIGRDVTREQQVDEGLRENDKLRAVAVLAGGIAHDFNNLLGSIIGLTELCALQAPAGSRLARNLGRIGQAGAKAAALVRKLLDFSRQKPLDLQPLPASDLLVHAEALLRAAIPADMTLAVAAEADGTVNLDLVQMEQVLLNLTRNAAHAMRQRGGEVRIVLDRAAPACTDTAPGGHLRLRVIDCGEGIPAAVLPRIFEPFYTTKPVGEGTGLGLAAVHGIVSSHGGRIEVDSTPGAGTTFSVYLPLAPAAALPAHDPLHTTAVAASG